MPRSSGTCMLEKARWPVKALSLLLLLTGAAALAMPRGYSLGFYSICFLGLALWLFQRNSLIEKGALPFAVPLLTYAAGHLLMGLEESFVWRTLDPVLPFGLMVFGLWVLRHYRPSASWFWAGLAIGAIVAGAISVYQVVTLVGRAHGFTHAIQFGNIALLFGVLCMVRALITLKLSWSNLLMWLGFICGVASSVWSQTRGGWVALVLIFSWVLFHALKEQHRFKRMVASVVLIACIILPAWQLNLHKFVVPRVSSAIEEINAYVKINKQDTSVGSRLAMWQFAIRELGDATWIGFGNHGWTKLRDQGIAKGELNSYIANFSHVHNEFIDVLLKRGVIGLGLLLLLYLGPMIWFFKPHLLTTNDEEKSLSMAGMVIPMMYMDFGLTQVFLSHNSGRMILVSLWMCTAALLLNAAEDNRQHDTI